jgi:hypothetical protein
LALALIAEATVYAEVRQITMTSVTKIDSWTMIGLS